MSLQRKDIDLITCADEVVSLVDVLKEWRENDEISFHFVFVLSTLLQGAPLQLPLIIKLKLQEPH